MNKPPQVPADTDFKGRRQYFHKIRETLHILEAAMFESI
jgi:hypothetical protein